MLEKIRKQQFPYLLNVFTLTNNHTNVSITSTFYALRKKNQNQNSPNSDLWSLSFHHRAQNSSHEENSSDLRTDDYLWVQYLENIQNDSIQ